MGAEEEIGIDSVAGKLRPEKVVRSTLIILGAMLLDGYFGLRMMWMMCYKVD